jgi:hemerythrin-like domain-containing protein
MNAIKVVLDEHRSLAAMLHGMLFLVRAIGQGRMTPDFTLLRSMVYYIDAFPERYHHPKEDAYLFRLLRLRCPESGSLIDRLLDEHRTGASMIRELEHSLLEYEHDRAADVAGFAATVERYAAFHWQHMRAEEDELIPLARRHLEPADWNEIDDAFAGHSDPLLGAKAEGDFDALFRRIVHLAPPPIGVGPER